MLLYKFMVLRSLADRTYSGLTIMLYGVDKAHAINRFHEYMGDGIGFEVIEATESHKFKTYGML